MSQLLEKIEADLSELEETLLAELRRLRKTSVDEVYATLSEDVSMQVQLTADSLRDVLNSSGDASNLSLKTEQHETIEARIDVLSQLLSKKIPAVFIETTHQEVKASRQQLTAKVAASRFERKADAEDKKPGLFTRIFSREETKGEQARNPNHVTEEEQNRFEADKGYNDSGVFSASRELAILCEQVRLHVDEGQSIDKVAQERAEFLSKDLSSGTPELNEPESRDIARSPEAIRNKLQNRGAAPTGKSSTFVARDIQPVADPEPPRKREKKAQSPEEIRRKLEARKSEDSAAAGKAVFGAKDLSNAPPPTMPDPIKTEPEPLPEPEPPTGKAIFGSKDIEPEFERYDQARVRRSEKEAAKKEAARKSGKASFASKDLDDPKN